MRTVVCMEANGTPTEPRLTQRMAVTRAIVRKVPSAAQRWLVVSSLKQKAT